MKTPEEIGQWVIDNRYPKNEHDKVSDVEMYHVLVNSINELIATDKPKKKRKVIKKSCRTCKHWTDSTFVEPCHSCSGLSNFVDKHK